MVYDVHFIERLMHGDWTNHMITHVMNDMRDWGVDLTGHPKKFSRTIITNTTKRAMMLITGDNKWAEKRWRKQDDLVLTPATDYTTGQFLGTRLLDDKKHVFISSLANGVRFLPTDDDRGTLTEVVELVLKHPELDRPLAELDTLLEHVNVVPYDLTKDQRCQALWAAEAAKFKVRFYDITNQYNLGGAVKPAGLDQTKSKRKSKSSDATSDSKKTSKRKMSSEVDDVDKLEVSRPTKRARK
jgi:hypothetical protein